MNKGLFNSSQLGSLGRAVLQIAGTYIVASGGMTGSEFEAIAGGVIAAVGVFLGWRKHRSEQPGQIG